MKERIEWSTENWTLNKLIPYDKNPRIITEVGLDQLKESFDEIGFAQPVNINTDGTILSGHARVQQLRREFTESVDVYIPNRKLTPKEEEAVIIRMNKNVAGSWDIQSLNSEEWNQDELLEWGFTEEELSLDFLEPEDLSDKNKEIDVDNFGNDLEHTCPKCGFEFND